MTGRDPGDGRPLQDASATVVLEVGGLHWASERAVVESVLGRRPGVLTVTANPVAQTATVRFDPARTGVAGLRGWVREGGCHCAGPAVPTHVCDPLAEPMARPAALHAGPPLPRAPYPAAPPHPRPEVHAGHGPGHEMAAMVADMRNRFVVAAGLSVPILLWSPIGRDVLGFQAAAPLRLPGAVFCRLPVHPVVPYLSADLL